ncbi:hypothetical protein Csac_3002 [Caldicellulosiruptor saccharolyticus DSM 8903]|uniref:Uncharacterized protein n=1 Tax=Caldicellulosiruptor saccharolyticus (strain ATCC 43494 / DSM 8903 / Tp8T 6331) TaxID=351627 RepID=G2JCE8_CALS8|nr:hypothetical protein [Caldicellulosiruptor saccharolyticus]AEN71898.1 hypothetical protein Csac_3002 [Caldicellulosiruptor saccharolyticus DSM 8903]
MVNESVFKNGYFVELNSYEMEFVNGGLDKALSRITLIKDLYEFAKELWDFGRGFADGWRDATR